MSMEELKKFPAFISFMEEVKELKEEVEGILKSEDEVNKIYRAQGAVNFAERIIDLTEATEEKREEQEEEDIGY